MRVYGRQEGAGDVIEYLQGQIDVLQANIIKLADGMIKLSAVQERMGRELAAYVRNLEGKS